MPYPCEHVCTLTGCYNIRSRPLRPEPRRDRRVLSKPPRPWPRRVRGPSVERVESCLGPADRYRHRPAPLSLSSPNL